jgi:hypothetical protein
LTQLLFGLTRLGRCRDDASVISVGARHERVLHWLANRVRSVVATDLYEGKWQSDGADATQSTKWRGVVKPGGLVVVATEYILADPSQQGACQPHAVHALFDRRACGSSSRSTKRCTNATSTWPWSSDAIRTRHRPWSSVTAIRCLRR